MEGEIIGTIYDPLHYGEIQVILGRHLSGRPAIWLKDPLLERVVAIVSVDEPKVRIESGELLVRPRKCFKRMIDSILQIGAIEDTGQRLRIGYQSTQIWKIKDDFQCQNGSRHHG